MENRISKITFRDYLFMIFDVFKKQKFWFSVQVSPVPIAIGVRLEVFRFYKTQKKFKISFPETLNFYLAERMGFEPTIQLPIYKLSRLAPSTTRTPLYFGLQITQKNLTLQKQNLSYFYMLFLNSSINNFTAFF